MIVFAIAEGILVRLLVEIVMRETSTGITVLVPIDHDWGARVAMMCSPRRPASVLQRKICENVEKDVPVSFSERVEDQFSTEELA